MRTKVFAVLLIFAGLLILAHTLSSGRAMLEIGDLTKTAEARAASSWLPFRSGALYVTVEGRMDGKGLLHTYSNHDRDYSRIDLRGEKISEHFGNAEAWADDLRVVFEPMGATQGELRIALVCGETQRRRKYSSLSANRG